MKRQYTLSQQGNRWIASNGTDHVEDDSPEDALDCLLAAENERENGSGLPVEDGVDLVRAVDVESRCRNVAAGLIALLAQDAIAVVLRNNLTCLGKLVEKFIQLRGLDK